MKKLNDIKMQIDAANAVNSATISVLRKQATAEFEKQMKKKNAVILSIVTAVESSRELSQIDHDDYFCQWTRIDFSSLIDTNDEFQKELLQEYFQEHYCLSVDFKNDVVTYSVGPSLLIFAEGASKSRRSYYVYDQDSGKEIISFEQCLDDDGNYSREKRNELIEQWMEKKGYFPSVIKVDHYGNAHYVSTQKSEVKKESEGA
jgi:hypothetical protein